MHFIVRTAGHTDFHDLTEHVEEEIRRSKVTNGTATIHVAHTTASVAIMENEEGFKQDVRTYLEKIAPADGHYEHNSPGDSNGYAHLRSLLIGTNVSLPIENGQMTLGTWQRVMLIDFDDRARERDVFVSVTSQ
jgi:secondary thiamine-phosphate synthase enzyme